MHLSTCQKGPPPSSAKSLWDDHAVASSDLKCACVFWSIFKFPSGSFPQCLIHAYPRILATDKAQEPESQGSHGSQGAQGEFGTGALIRPTDHVVLQKRKSQFRAREMVGWIKLSHVSMNIGVPNTHIKSHVWLLISAWKPSNCSGGRERSPRQAG